jgi:hypothetical protein
MVVLQFLLDHVAFAKGCPIAEQPFAVWFNHKQQYFNPQSTKP